MARKATAKDSSSATALADGRPPAKSAPKAKSKVLEPRKARPELDPAHTPSAGDSLVEKQISTVFTDRLTQILDRRDGVIRGGRGRVGDFARFFDVHYTTAQRLLAGTSLPSVVLLTQIAKALQVPAGWLIGDDDEYDVDQKLEKSVIKICRYSPRDAGHMAVHVPVPMAELPAGFDSSQLVYAKAIGRNGIAHTVVARVLLEPVNDVIHLIYYPKNNFVCLRRVQVMPSVGKVYIHPADGTDSEVFKMDKMAFGDTSAEADGKVCIVGPVVASLNYGIDFS